jgi:hypothetical protein
VHRITRVNTRASGVSALLEWLEQRRREWRRILKGMHNRSGGT